MFARFMVSDRASHGSSHKAVMARHMIGRATHDRSLNATFGVRRIAGC